jgi:hypothetical protein
MPQLHMKLSEKMANKRRAKSRNFEVAFADVPQIADVLFVGCDGEHLGDVVAKASPAGREAVDKLFPGTHAEWRDGLGQDAAFFPDDWKEFTFVIPSLLIDLPRFGLKHNLPQHLINLRPVEKISSDQWAMLMAIGAKDQGARAAFWSISQNKLTIIRGPRTFNYHGNSLRRVTLEKRSPGRDSNRPGLIIDLSGSNYAAGLPRRSSCTTARFDND